MLDVEISFWRVAVSAQKQTSSHLAIVCPTTKRMLSIPLLPSRSRLIICLSEALLFVGGQMHADEDHLPASS
jgi:hypothetical protein